MYFSKAAESFDTVLSEENIKLSGDLRNNLLTIMSEMCNYSEEDHKIRPQLILGSNINTFFETVASHSYYIMYKDEINGTNLPRYFKSLALFCDNGWYIVINVREKELEYGIFRRYTNIDGKKFEDYFKDQFDSTSDGNMIIIKTINNFDILVVRSKQDDLIISQRFVDPNNGTQINEAEVEKYFDNLSEDIIQNCKLENKKYLKDCFLRLLRNLPLRIHGTIMLVVDDSFELQGKSLSGITINPCIDFETVFEQYRSVERYEDAEKVYSLIGALYEMLNTDGITIISNSAKLTYYNVFYEGNIPKNIKGGARKRTALGILDNQELSGVIGVYFQSQDGALFYRKRSIHE